MGRRRKSRRTRGRSNFVIPLVCLGILLLLAFITYMVYQSTITKSIKYDSVSMCRMGEEPTDLYAVLIDSTESLPNLSASQAIIKVRNLLKNAPVNSQITLYSIQSGNERHVRPLATICKPETGESASELTSNPYMIKKRFNDGFLIPLEGHLNSLVQGKGSETSPIIESLQSTVVESFESTQNTGNKKIIVISDMIQNSDLYSFYRNKPNFEEYKELSNKTGIGVINLRGISVELLVVPRKSSKVKRQDIIRFWREFLIGNNAALTSAMDPLS